MYPQSTVDIARQLSDIGILDRENAQICGVSIRSIRHWRSGDRRAQRGRRTGTRVPRPTCPRCHGRALDETAYAYLLGLYLGDGHITRGPRSYVLWLACADAWLACSSRLVRRWHSSCRRPRFSALREDRPLARVKSVSKHWPCLFPQHGPGRNTSAASSLSRGKRRSWRGIPATSHAAFSTLMDTVGSTGSGGRSLVATGGTSIRAISS
jgi:hypothetical protein